MLCIINYNSYIIKVLSRLKIVILIKYTTRYKNAKFMDSCHPYLLRIKQLKNFISV